MQLRSLTISGMHKIDGKAKCYSFDNLNYLYGPNGAGKSTVLQAIQLAILGYIPGTPKTPAAIFKHANGPEMKIRLEFDDGRFIQRIWKTKGRSVESKLDSDISMENPAVILGDLELPIFNFGELIGMTANKLKDWFINFLPNASDEIDWRKELTDSLNGLELMDKNLLDSVLQSIEVSSENYDSTIELIQALNEQWKEEQSYLKAELKRSDDTIQSLVYYDEEDLTGDEDSLNEEVANCRAEIDKLTKDKEKLIEVTQIMQSNASINAQLAAIPESSTNVDDLKAKSDQLSKDIVTYQADVTKIESSVQTMMQEGYQIDADIRAKQGIINSQGICPYTRSKCDSIVSMIEEFQKEVSDLQQKKLDLQSKVQVEQTNLQAAKVKVATAQAEMNRIYAESSQAQNNQANKERLQSLLRDVPVTTGFMDASWYSSKIADLHERITKIEANKRYNNLIDKLTAQKYTMENTLEAYKSWIKLTDPNGLQTKIMDTPFNDLATDMDAYLMKMFSSSEISCKFNLEQKANSFSFGLERNGKYIPYDLLSSGEKTMYTLAMMLCIIDKSKSEVKLLIADDMLDHLDDERADEVFEAIKNIEGIQVVVAGVKNSSHADEYRIDIV